MKGDDTLKAELAKAIAECEHLREENARLKHRVGEAPDHDPRPERPRSSAEERPATVTVASPPEVKVSLFKALFRGRDDVYAVRWEGKSGRVKSTMPEAEAVSAWFYPLPLWPSNRDLAAEC